MRILFAADVHPDPDSGAAGTEYQIIQALRRLGHEVDELWSDDLPHRIKHGNLHYLFELPFAYRKIMLEKLKTKDYDVININQPHGYLAAKTLKKLKKKCLFIHRSHGFEMRVQRDLAPWQRLYENDKRPVIKKILSELMAAGLSYNGRNIARYADGHIVSASQCAEFLRDVMGVPDDRIAVIPQASPATFNDTLSVQMTSERLKRILYIGQFAFFKAPMIVAATMNRLVDKMDGLNFTWVCSIRHHREVEQLLSPSLKKKIKLLDWIPQRDLMNIYDDHGIFLFPSFFEGFGKVFLEAMSRGLCVVAADNGGAHDVIDSGKNGILVPTGDVESMVEACLDLCAHYDTAEMLSSNAALSARKYSWERVAQETIEFYRRRLEADLGPRY